MSYKTVKKFGRRDEFDNHVEVSFMRGETGKIEWIRICTFVNGLKLRSDYYKDLDVEFKTVFKREDPDLFEAEQEHREPRLEVTAEILRKTAGESPK